MKPMSYIGLDVHKRTIRYCVKNSIRRIISRHTFPIMDAGEPDIMLLVPAWAITALLIGQQRWL